MRNLIFIFKLYVIAALIYATILSPFNLSFVPIILLCLYIFQWIRPLSAVVEVLSQYFIFFAIALLYSSILPVNIAPLISLPILVLIDQSLKKAARVVKSRRPRYKYHPTRIMISLSTIALTILLLSIIVADFTLILASAVIIIYFICIGIVIIKRFPVKPILEEQVQIRIIAGKKEDVQIRLNPITKLGMTLYFESDLDWVKINTQDIYLKGEESSLHLSVAPVLSGPSVVKISGYAIDQWGFFQTAFEISPLHLTVIPRARYASWLARKYLSGSNPGELPLISHAGINKMLKGFRQGIEFYGNREYRDGDNMKNINWKASAKHNKLISKEFDEFRGQPAVLLINLIAGNGDELDKLAYNILVTAISLGQENIPTALAVYDKEKVVMITPLLSSFQLVSYALKTVKQLSIHTNPLKYLNPPDVAKLRANISRLSNSGSAPAKKLSELLSLEYTVINNGVGGNPCTQALLQVKAKIKDRFSVVLLSQYNHDAEALSVHTYTITCNGGTVIDIGKYPESYQSRTV